jgi:hypothetical protein
MPAAASNHNESRFAAYRTAAIEFVRGEAYDPNELAHLLSDLRWNEVPRSFSVAINNASRMGPIRTTIGESFGGLLEYICFLSFGSTERRVVAPWFLQNIDFFFLALFDGLLLLNQKNTVLRADDRIHALSDAFHAVFRMIDHGRMYMSLDEAVASTGVHALLAACSSTKGTFIKNGTVQFHEPSDGDPACDKELTLAHILFMDHVAGKILEDEDRNVETWTRPFGYFSGSKIWRSFARRCLLAARPVVATNFPSARPMQSMFVTNICKLQQAQQDAFLLLRNERNSLEVLLEQEDMAVQMMREYQQEQPPFVSCIRESSLPGKEPSVVVGCIRQSALKRSHAEVKEQNTTGRSRQLIVDAPRPNKTADMIFESGNFFSSTKRNSVKRQKRQGSLWGQLPQDLLSLILCNRLGDALTDTDHNETLKCVLGLRLVSKGVMALTESYIALQTTRLHADAKASMNDTDILPSAVVEVADRARAMGLTMIDVIRLTEQQTRVLNIQGWTLPKAPRMAPNWRWFMGLRQAAKKRLGEKAAVTTSTIDPKKAYQEMLTRHCEREPHIWHSRFSGTIPTFAADQLRFENRTGVLATMHKVAGV